MAGARGAGALTGSGAETGGGAETADRAQAGRGHEPRQRPLRIGLTGPIGCGKSTIAGWLVAWGGSVIDADAFAREVTRPGETAHDAVLARFGEPVRRADGTLDRTALAALVFADPTALRELEAIVHPAVRPRILAALGAAERAEAGVVVLEAIKLIESGYAPLLDEVWLITCLPDEQLARLAARGQPEADAMRRIDAQFGLVERLAPVATRVIDTGGSIDSVRGRIAAALADALRLHHGRRVPTAPPDMETGRRG